MTPIITGIHHVTALAGEPRRHVSFYRDVLGLRLVKKTVNFDDPHTYHLYYGDEIGSPGTLLTHFPHPRAARARHGHPEIARTVLAVPPGALSDWRARFDKASVSHQTENIGEVERLLFDDPDGMQFGLVESAQSPSGYTGSGVEPESAIGCIEGVVLAVEDTEATAAFLERTLGFVRSGEAADRTWLSIGPVGIGQRLELVQAADSKSRGMGAGSVHHVAWRVPDGEAQAQVADALRSAGVATTPVMDRQYFRSIYFRIEGGLIFEVATDGPGFDIDEPKSELGKGLKLPPQYESMRQAIAAGLIPID